MKKSDYQIQLTLEYNPVLKDYPPEITSKQEALRFDLRSVFEGRSNLDSLIQSCEQVTYGILEVPAVASTAADNVRNFCHDIGITNHPKVESLLGSKLVSAADQVIKIQTIDDALAAHADSSVKDR